MSASSSSSNRESPAPPAALETNRMDPNRMEPIVRSRSMGNDPIPRVNIEPTANTEDDNNNDNQLDQDQVSEAPASEAFTHQSHLVHMGESNCREFEEDSDMRFHVWDSQAWSNNNEAKDLTKYLLNHSTLRNLCTDHLVLTQYISTMSQS